MPQSSVSPIGRVPPPRIAACLIVPASSSLLNRRLSILCLDDPRRERERRSMPREPVEQDERGSTRDSPQARTRWNECGQSIVRPTGWGKSKLRPRSVEFSWKERGTEKKIQPRGGKRLKIGKKKEGTRIRGQRGCTRVGNARETREGGERWS